MKKSDSLIINFSRNSLKYILCLAIFVMWYFYRNDNPCFSKVISSNYYFAFFFIDLYFIYMSFCSLPAWIVDRKSFQLYFLEKMLVVVYLYFCLQCCWSRGLYKLVLEKQEYVSLMNKSTPASLPITKNPPSKFGQFIIYGNRKCWKDEKNQYWVFKKNVVPESSHWNVVNQDGKKIMKVSVGGNIL